jgi:hypothetical protein
MNHDLLLAWISERGSGRWSHFKDAHDWLAGGYLDGRSKAAWMTARDLSALGHLELSWDSGTWSVAPPTLTLLPGVGRALLTGARPRSLFWVDRLGQHHGALVDVVDEANLYLDPWDQRDGPSTVAIELDSLDQAASMAKALGIPFTFSVAETLAGLLPDLGSYERTWSPGELLDGFDVELFDTATLYWEPVAETDVAGLYRSRTHSNMRFALRTPAGGWVRPSPEPAVYEVLRWDDVQVLDYEPARRELRVPGTTPLPALAARAATLCSGRVPRRVKDGDARLFLEYLNVPPTVAQAIARSLRQEIPCV